MLSSLKKSLERSANQVPMTAERRKKLDTQHRAHWTEFLEGVKGRKDVIEEYIQRVKAADPAADLAGHRLLRKAMKLLQAEKPEVYASIKAGTQALALAKASKAVLQHRQETTVPPTYSSMGGVYSKATGPDLRCRPEFMTPRALAHPSVAKGTPATSRRAAAAARAAETPAAES